MDNVDRILKELDKRIIECQLEADDYFKRGMEISESSSLAMKYAYEHAKKIVENEDKICSSACSKHKPNNMGYLQWHDWAEKEIKRGAKQKQCPKCGRWYFRSEY